MLRREHVRPPPDEPLRDSTRRSLFVSTDPDPLAAGRILQAGLEEHRAAWRSTVPTYVRAARTRHPEIKDPTERLARYLAGLPNLEWGDFWRMGLDWGEPSDAEERLLLPLERWVLACVLFEEVGGVPLMLSWDLGAPPSAAGFAPFDDVGVLVPGLGLVLDDGFVPAPEGTSARLAGVQTVQMTADSVELVPLASDAAHAMVHWVGVVSSLQKRSVHMNLTVAFQGDRAIELRRSWDSWLESRNAVAPGNRVSLETWEARFVGRVIERAPRKGSVTVEDDRRDFVQLWASVAAGESLAIEGETALMEIPLRVEHELVSLTPVRRRKTPLRLDLIDERWNRTFLAPDGYTLGAIPDSETHAAGPINVSVVWEGVGRGARLTYQLQVNEQTVDPVHAKDVQEAARILQELDRTKLVFVRSPEPEPEPEEEDEVLP